MTLLGGKLERAGARVRHLVVVGAIAVVMSAVAADAAIAGDAMVRPSVQGYGSVSSLGYSCSNFSPDDRVVQTACGTATATPPFFGNAVIAMTATPFTAPGNTFARWDNCVLPLGATGSATVSGTTCTLTLSFISATVLMTPRAVFDDVAGPTISTVTPSYSSVSDRSVSFAVSANEVMSAVECSVDGDVFAACSSVRPFSEGSHTVRARARDMSDNLGATTVASNFRIVDTALVSGPPDVSAARRPTFTYSTLAGMTFECSVDNVVLASCGTKDPATNRGSFTPPADLADGVHTFRVRGKDGTDFDRVPVVRTWRVDTTAPALSAFGSPAISDGVLTTARTAAFTFGATDAGGIARFECKLDGGAFESCTSPKEYSDLGFGEHTFTARAVDGAGNVGPAQSRGWTVAARDSDGDGFSERVDCRDDNPAINPSATDVPGNGVDENCDGADSAPPSSGSAAPAAASSGAPSSAALPRIVSLVSFKAKPGPASTRFVTFTVKNVPAGSTVTAACKGKACGKSAKQTVTNAKGTVVLKKLQRAFNVGSVIEVRITRPGMQGMVRVLTIRKRKAPAAATKCLAGAVAVACA